MASSLLALTFLLSLSLITLPTNAKNPKKFVTQLVHTSSVYSHPNESIKDRADRSIKSSNARFMYLRAKINQNLAIQKDTYLADLYLIRNGFAVNFLIGQPPVAQLAIMDTGSDLVWIQCEDCEKCFPQEGPKYNHSSSSTYKDITCTSEYECGGSHQFCDTNYGCCNYEIRYADNSSSSGRIGTETLTFETRDEATITAENILFGCARNSTMTSLGSNYGIFGLGFRRPSFNSLGNSILLRLGHKFSYCVGNVFDNSYEYNKLKIGEDVDIEGDPTPMEINLGVYFINLERISIDVRTIDIDLSVILDTGSEYTYLPPVTYDEVKRMVQDILNPFLEPLRDKSNDGSLCYSGNLRRDLKGFPMTVLGFSGGAELDLEIESMFTTTDKGVFCMAMLPSDSDDVALIGMLAQQYYNIGYDIDQNKVYFQRIDCQLLDD